MEKSSVQYKLYVIKNAHMHSTPSLRSFPSAAFKSVLMLVWLRMALSNPFNYDCQSLPLSTNLHRSLSLQGNWWCDALGFGPTAVVSQAPQHFNQGPQKKKKHA